MRYSTYLCVAAAWLVSAFSVVAGDEDPFDFTQAESPKRPSPAWVEMVDHGKANERLKGYQTPAGIKVEIVADFPNVRNPVGMAFAPDGTAYVIEWTRGKDASVKESVRTLTYKDGSKHDVVVLEKSGGDLIKSLTFNKEKGFYDQSKTVLEEELPAGILFYDGWLYVPAQGKVRRHRQSKAGGPFDVHETVAQGFGGWGRNGVSGMTIGNDGLLYVTAGSGDNIVEGSDGQTATVLRTGAVFRSRPDGSKMQLYAQGFCNPRGNVTFDALGNMFAVDTGTEDGSKFQGCRLMHVVLEADYGWRLMPGAREIRPDLARGAVYGELPGTLAPMAKSGRGCPNGVTFYNDDRFPERYRELLFYPDPVRRSIRAYKLKPDGSTFQVAEQFELMTSDDPLFQPCQMVVGPDGAMYVVDRRSSNASDQLWGDGEHGRIYRLTWTGVEGDAALEPRPMDCLTKIAKLGDDEIFQTLASESMTERLAAQREIVRRGKASTDRLVKMVEDFKQPLPARLAALGAFHAEWFPYEALGATLIKLLQSDEPSLRRLAAEALDLYGKKRSKEIHNALFEALSDIDPGARRSIILALGAIAGPGAYDSLASAFSFDDGKDASLSDAFLRALERGGKDGLERLLALADSGDQKMTDRVAEAFLGLRSRAAAELLPDLLKSRHLNVSQRAAVLRSYGNYRLDPPNSVDPLVRFLEKDADDERALKLAGLAVLSSGVHVKPETVSSLLLTYLKDEDPTLRLATIRAITGLRLTKAGPELAKILADGGRTTTERIAIARTLGMLGDHSDTKASAALQDIAASKGKDAAPAILRAEALRALSCVDSEAAQLAAKKLLDDQYRDVQIEAVRTLGSTRQGARAVGEHATSNDFPRWLLPHAFEVLACYAESDTDAAKQLNKITKDGLKIRTDEQSLEKLRDQVKSKGDGKRGRAVFVECGCANCHRLEGLGTSVGPDLTGTTADQPLERLIAKILEPSKDVRPGYLPIVAVTKTGQTFTGLRAAQTGEEVILRDGAGRDVRLVIKDLSKLSLSSRSMMPDHVCSALSMEEFADLLALLTSVQAQENLRGIVRDFNVIGPFTGKLADFVPVEQRPDPEAAYKDEKSGDKLHWQSAQVSPSGMLDLRSLISKVDVSAYALTYVYSPKAQKVPLLFGAGCTARVWVNDEMIHEQTGAVVPQPDKKQLEVQLNEGWNSVLVKVMSCATCHGLYLRFDGGDGLKFARRTEGQ